MPCNCAARHYFVWSARTLIRAVVTLDGLGHRGEIVIIRGGGTDILKEFRDLEIGGLVGFGGGILDGFARGLQFSLFVGACDVQLNCRLYLWVKRDDDVMQAEFLDRAGQCDLLAFETEAVFGGRVGRSSCGRITDELFLIRVA